MCFNLNPSKCNNIFFFYVMMNIYALPWDFDDELVGGKSTDGEGVGTIASAIE